MNPNTSLTLIARDEASRLPACLASVRDLVDDIVVVDNVTGRFSLLRWIEAIPNDNQRPHSDAWNHRPACPL